MTKQHHQLFIMWIFWLLLSSWSQFAAASKPLVILPNTALKAKQLAVIVNNSDPLSINIAHYYQAKRAIPAENLIYVDFDPGKTIMSPGEFAVLKRVVEAKLPDGIQAFALTWAAPYRVGCMSISSAFAFGYDVKYCAQGCKPTYPSPYFNSESQQPFTHFGIRPTMLLAADNLKDAENLIDRGLAADGTLPQGSAYLLKTSDKNRSVRKRFYSRIENALGSKITIKIMQAEAISHQRDVMFYFTGQTWVSDLDTNYYLPGAVADHLTSSGGQLTGGAQMSAMDWLKAGVTGSYGTVVEPCNLTSKFPNPLVLMDKYLSGESLLEAYWKSVQMPGQGVFIGEPLAKPYAAYQLQQQATGLTLSSPVLKPGYYSVSVADKIGGPFKSLLAAVEISPYKPTIQLPLPAAAVYKVERLAQIGQPVLPLKN